MKNTVILQLTRLYRKTSFLIFFLETGYVVPYDIPHSRSSATPWLASSDWIRFVYDEDIIIRSACSSCEEQVVLILWIPWPFSERKFYISTIENYFILYFICKLRVNLFSLVWVPKANLVVYSLVKEHSQRFLSKCTVNFPMFFSPPTSSITFLMQRLVVRRRRSAPPSRLSHC